jgi:hypothetical protein
MRNGDLPLWWIWMRTGSTKIGKLSNFSRPTSLVVGTEIRLSIRLLEVFVRIYILF